MNGLWVRYLGLIDKIPIHPSHGVQESLAEQWAEGKHRVGIALIMGGVPLVVAVFVVGALAGFW
jgi:hypothetical protein